MKKFLVAATAALNLAAAGARTLAAFAALAVAATHAAAQSPAVATVPGMPPVVDPANLYSEAAAGRSAPATANALARVYVPNVRSNDVYVIDPATMKVVDKFKVGLNPQHVVPSWDLQDPVGRQQCRAPHRRQPHADRSRHRQARQARAGRRSLQHVFHAGRHTRRSSSPKRTSASTSAIRTRCSSSTRWRRRSAAASTTPTSRSMAASPSSPASSRRPRQDRHVERKVLGYLKLSQGRHAAGHSHLARRQ